MPRLIDLKNVLLSKLKWWATAAQLPLKCQGSSKSFWHSPSSRHDKRGLFTHNALLVCQNVPCSSAKCWATVLSCWQLKEITRQNIPTCFTGLGLTVTYFGVWKSTRWQFKQMLKIHRGSHTSQTRGLWIWVSSPLCANPNSLGAPIIFNLALL